MAENDGHKFVRLMNFREVRLTVCAVSRLPGIDKLPELPGFRDLFVEPNQKWQENPTDQRAWVKIYCSLDSPLNSSSNVFSEGMQKITIPMPFFGQSSEECWGELQILIKKVISRSGRMLGLSPVQLGRHYCFDTRVGAWVKEEKPIIPKKDLGTHAFLSLRIYHQDFLPKIPSSWHWEPLYILFKGKVYKVEAVWQGQKIVIKVAELWNLSEAPGFLVEKLGIKV